MTPSTAGGTGCGSGQYGVRLPDRVASAYGALSYTYANNDSVGIRPVMNLDGEVEVVSNLKICRDLSNRGSVSAAAPFHT